MQECWVREGGMLGVTKNPLAFQQVTYISRSLVRILHTWLIPRDAYLEAIDESNESKDPAEAEHTHEREIDVVIRLSPRCNAHNHAWLISH